MNERFVRVGVVLVGLAIAGCSSSSSGGSSGAPSGSSTSSSGSPGTSTSSSSGAPSSSGTAATRCTVTFGGDASSVKATECSQMGPFTSDATAIEFHGAAEGLDAPIYSVTVKYPNGIAAGSYETKDLFYISANLGVTSTGKTYFVDFDSRDASKERHGSVKTVLTSADHGTIDIVYDSSDPPITQATMHITF